MHRYIALLFLLHGGNNTVRKTRIYFPPIQKLDFYPIMTSQAPQQSTQTSRLVESLLSGDRAALDGICCNDPNGLCLISKGNMNGGNESGTYTSLMRLASQLYPQQEGSMSNEAPLVNIETDSSSILVKEYHGHTVAMKVPNRVASDQADE
jgi:hypothetical protein